METSNIKIHVEYQRLTVGSGVRRYASDTINYILAEFDLGDEWQEFDAVQAIWKSKYDTIRVLLDTEGHCMVPQEVLSRESKVQVNLVGFTSDGETLTSRLTSYPVIVLDVDAKAELDGSRSEEITPTQFERFVSQVSEASRSANDAADRAQTSESAAAESEISALNSMTSANDAADRAQTSESAAAESEISALNSMTSASDSELSAAESADRAEAAKAFLESASAEATTLTPGSQATASYSEGVFRFGIPQGDVNIEQLRALLPTETVSGEVVSITDGQSVVPADSLEVSLSPIQDLHGYDAPWVGGAGKNLFDVSYLTGQSANGVYFTAQNDGRVKASGTAVTQGWTYINRSFTLPYNGIDAGDQILLYGSAQLYVRFYDDTYAQVGSAVTRQPSNTATTTVPSSATKMEIYVYTGYTYPSAGQTVNETLEFYISKDLTFTSWTPYTNICPISGRTEVVTQRTGKNLLNPYTFVGGVIGTTGSLSTANVVNLSVNDGVITYTSTRTWRGVTSEYIEVDDSKSYVFSLNGTPTGVMWSWYDKNKAFISQQYESLANLRAKTPPTGAKYLRITPEQSAQGTYSYSDVQLELGTTATAHEPYQGTTYTTTLGRTVYGGTLDVVSGVLTVDRAMVILDGTQSISIVNWQPTSSGVGWVYPYSLTNNKIERADSYTPKVVSDSLPTITYRAAYQGTSVGVTTLATTGTTSYGLVVRTADASLTTASAINAYLSANPITVVYELANPQTIQLTPQEVQLLLGTNNVWSDGDVTLVYNADIQRYIEKKLNA